MKETVGRLQTRITKRIDLNYLLYKPERRAKSARRALPLILFLHGAGERGDDLELVKVHGPPRVIEEGRELPFVVAAPQCPAGTWWQIDPLRALLDRILEDHEIDERRVCLTGLSMGGYGAWALADEYPDRFAAVAPVCAPFTWIRPEGFKELPVWSFHGAMDDVVPISDAVRMVRWVREAGGDVRFTVYPEADHDAWTPTYGGRDLYGWFLEQKRP